MEGCKDCERKDRALKKLRSELFRANRENPKVFPVAAAWLTIIQRALGAKD